MTENNQQLLRLSHFSKKKRAKQSLAPAFQKSFFLLCDIKLNVSQPLEFDRKKTNKLEPSLSVWGKL